MWNLSDHVNQKCQNSHNKNIESNHSRQMWWKVVAAAKWHLKLFHTWLNLIGICSRSLPFLHRKSPFIFNNDVERIGCCSHDHNNVQCLYERKTIYANIFSLKLIKWKSSKAILLVNGVNKIRSCDYSVPLWN